MIGSSIVTRPCKPSRILSIQSHVVNGYVGNRAAVFPLQLLKHHVDFINTVNFTSMYIHEGEHCSLEALKQIFSSLGLAKDGSSLQGHPGPLKNKNIPEVPISYPYVISGYAGNSGILNEVCGFLQHQREMLDAKFLWVCDPVIGDNGRMYVPKEILETYRVRVLPLADLITPNQHELLWLAGDDNVKVVTSIDNAFALCEKLLNFGPRYVVVTSLALPSSSDELYLYLGGMGDLMTAMITAGMDRFENNLQRSCLWALDVVQVVLFDVVNVIDAADIMLAYKDISPNANISD